MSDNNLHVLLNASWTRYKRRSYIEAFGDLHHYWSTRMPKFRESRHTSPSCMRNLRVSLLSCSSRHAGFRLPRLCATIGRSGTTCRAFLQPTSFPQGTTHAFQRHASWNFAFKHVSRQLCKHENLRSGELRTPLRTTVRTPFIIL